MVKARLKTPNEIFGIISNTEITSFVDDKCSTYNCEMRELAGCLLEFKKYDIGSEKYEYRSISHNFHAKREWLKDFVEVEDIDWGRVMVDAKVKVKDFNLTTWKSMHFAGVDESGKHYVWGDGKTSHTIGSGLRVHFEEIKLS